MEKGWIIIKTDGTVTEVPSDRKPTLEQMQKAVGGFIEYTSCRHEGKKRTLVVNEEGKLTGLPRNSKATELFAAEHGNRDVIVGDVMVLIGYRG